MSSSEVLPEITIASPSIGPIRSNPRFPSALLKLPRIFIIRIVSSISVDCVEFTLSISQTLLSNLPEPG